MKKILFSIALLLSIRCIATAAFDDDELLSKSSFTSTSEGPIAISTTLCPSGSIFDGVVIASSTPNGVLTIWDNNGVAISTIGIVSMDDAGTGAFYIPFEVRLSSGLTYKTVNNTTGVTIIFKNLRPN